MITAKEFDAIMEELEELEDIRLYYEAVADDTGERMLLSDYLKLRKFRDAEVQGDADQSGTKQLD